MPQSCGCENPRMNDYMGPWIKSHTIFRNNDKSVVQSYTTGIIESTGLRKMKWGEQKSTWIRRWGIQLIGNNKNLQASLSLWGDKVPMWTSRCSNLGWQWSLKGYIPYSKHGCCCLISGHDEVGCPMVAVFQSGFNLFLISMHCATWQTSASPPPLF